VETRIFHEIQAQIDEGFKEYSFNKKDTKIKSTNISYQDLEAELLRLMDLTRKGLFVGDKYHSLFVFGPTGNAKCLVPGTPILMFDGTIKKVEDIKIGDLLIGPDSKLRKVLSTTSGEEMMYDIIPVKGEKYTVNESHILSLKMTNDVSHGKLIKGNYTNISVKDYLKQSNFFKHKAKGWRTGIDWEEKDIPINPYYLGLWLGDGRSNWPSITNIDKEVISYLYKYANNISGEIYEDTGENKTTNYRIKFPGVKNNPLKDKMVELNLINNKHIPLIYKINSRKNRLQLLAGLLDSDGYSKNGGFQITQKRKQLADDILFLARSLGFAAYYKLTKNSAHKDHSNWYYRTIISGDCSIIPTKIKRKQAKKRKQKKDVLVTGIKVKQVGIGKYYGFTLEGSDRLFLLGDFTVTHNTEIVGQLAEKESFIYHKLELQKVPIEILQGFPYLKDVEIDQIPTQYELDQIEDDPKKEYWKKVVNKNPSIQSSAVERMIYKQKVAKLAPSTILPPSGDERCWVLHFDEFNKADADKMAAVMNLVLTGELGGSADFDGESSIKYRLPRRTVIIGTGNTKCQEAVQNLNVVSSMDTATSERWHRTCFLDYNATSWFTNFATKPFEFRGEKLDTRIPPILLNFILDRTLDTGDSKAAFLISIISGSEDGNETERTTSPRSWTLVADNMIMDGYNDWADKVANARTNCGPNFNNYMKDPEIQIKLLANQVYEFGLKGKQLVKEIISRYIYFAENRILPDDILFKYKAIRKRVEKLIEKKGVILYLLLGVGYYIDSYIKDYDVEVSAINISTFIQDTDISTEDLVAFIQTIDYSKNPKAKQIHDLLFDFSERYRNAYGGYYYTSTVEICKDKIY